MSKGHKPQWKHVARTVKALGEALAKTVRAIAILWEALED